MNLHPDRGHLWQSARILIACALAEAVSRLINIPETYWALITAIVVTRPMQSDSKEVGRDRTIGSIIGGVVGLGVLALERWGWSKPLLFCAAFVPLSLLVSIWPNLRLAAITLIVVVLVPSSNDPLVRPFDRVAEIVIGSIYEWLISVVLDSDRLRRRFPKSAPEAEEG